jgi:glutathione peroxidase
VEYNSIYDIPVEPMKAEGAGTKATSLAEYKGKVLLIVNVASKCGYTPQYTGLEALYRKYKDQGLVIVGFPSNDFKGQEPGTEQEIVTFCKSKYDVSFPLFAKVTVKGDNKAPLYKYLTEGDHPGKSEVGWNFNKWLVGRDGKVIAHYDSKVKPDDAALTSAIEAELSKK